MTRTAGLRAALVAVPAAAVWAVAAYFLWRTRVPGDLHLPQVDPHRYFSSALLSRSARYERFVRIDFLLSQLALVAVLVVYAARGARFARESAAGRIGTGMLLAMLGLAFVWLAQVPFGLAELWWERRHGVSNDDYLSWIVGNFFLLGDKFLFICLAILIVMALARPLRHRWWIAGGPVFVGLTLLFAFVQPWLISDLHPLRKPALVQAAQRLERKEGLPRVPVEVQNVHEFTSAPNAEAAGLGPSRRVILWDTLLNGRFKDREVEFVLAHEFGHLARNHIWKYVAWYALFALPGAYVIAAATRRRGGMFQPRAVPLSLLVFIVLQLLALPVQNVISRHIESEADWMALETTRDPAAGRSLFRRFAATGLDQPQPPTWAYVIFENHPTLAQRIAMVQAWQKLRRRR